MNSSLLFFIILFTTSIKLCSSDYDNLQDVCPADTLKRQTVFINGLPCKNPSTVVASDFKTARLGRAGNTDNFFRSSTSIVTAEEFPGLNTLGLAVARTDLDVDGLIVPHAHPRASEMFFVSKGVVIAGFISTQNELFQKILKAGDVFVIPKGLLHYCVNAGYEAAVAFSVLNSQNPGQVKVAGSMYDFGPDLVDNVVAKIRSFSALETDGGIRTETPVGFNVSL